jgi:hypothetical protein
LTYGERYFLLKYFHIPTDHDDIDNPDRKVEEKEPLPAKTKKAITKHNKKELKDKNEQKKMLKSIQLFWKKLFNKKRKMIIFMKKIVQ